MAVFLRTVLLGGLVGIAGWWTWFFQTKINEHQAELEVRDAQILEQAREIESLSEENAQLEMALWLSKVDHRVAEIEVVDQVPSADDPEQVETRLRFVELSPEGEPLGEPREIVVKGSRIYLEALVIKFDDSFVEAGDALRGTSVCIFKRVFGENQKPSEGTPLDESGTRPLPYSGDELPDPLFAGMWEQFWDYANDPEMARAKGVRAVHGEAPFTEARPGRRYKIELRASGGLSIQPD